MTPVALLLSLFLLTTPALGTPSFDLHSYSLPSNAVTTTPPELVSIEGKDEIRFSFVAPLDGVCVAVQVVSVDGVSKVYALGRSVADKDETITGELPLVPLDVVRRQGGEADTYKVEVFCANPTHNTSATALYSQTYTIAANKPA